MNNNQRYLKYMKRAMELAENGAGKVSPNPLVGAVLVRGEKIIAKDWHRKFGEGHAEWNLLTKFKGNIRPSDVLIITLEPCCHFGRTPPCTEIILEKNVKKVVIGILDPNPKVNGKGVEILKKHGVEVEISKNPKLLAELKWQNRFFFNRFKTEKSFPWVTLKIAQSLDGRVGFDRQHQLWLTGEETRKHVHKIRSCYDAILVGVKTVMVDNPKFLYQKAIVLDSKLSIPLANHIVRPGTIVFYSRLSQKRDSKKKQLQNKGIIVVKVSANVEDFLNLQEVLAELAARRITSLLVEGGPSVWSSFLRERLVDELMIYFAPKVLGDGVATFQDLGFSAQKLKFREMKILGNDIFWNGVFI